MSDKETYQKAQLSIQIEVVISVLTKPCISKDPDHCWKCHVSQRVVLFITHKPFNRQNELKEFVSFLKGLRLEGHKNEIAVKLIKGERTIENASHGISVES